MPNGSYKIRIDIGTDFSIATLMTYGGKCEQMHGHNYQVAIEIEGQLNEDSLVYDFREIKRILRKLCKELDEHFIYPRKSKELNFDVTKNQVVIKFKDRKYSLPKDDVIFLNLPNISAETLASYLFNRIKEILDISENISSMVVEVQEKPGQSASYKEAFQS